jgi:hypothetical protein
MEQNTKDVFEAVNFIKERMLTKGDVRDIIRNEVPQIVRGETQDIHAELTSIRRDSEALTARSTRSSVSRRRSIMRSSGLLRSKSTSASTRKSPPDSSPEPHH